MAEMGHAVSVLPKKQSAKTATTRARATRAAQNKTAQTDIASSQPARTSKASSTTGTRKKGTQQIQHTEAISSSSDDDLADSCPRCLLVLKGQLVKCDVCLLKMHVCCTSVPSAAHSMLVKYAKDIGWVCDDCKEAMNTSYHRLQTSISLLTEELSTIRTQLDNIQHAGEARVTENAVSVLPKWPMTRTDDNDTHISLVVTRTLNDTQRRKRNVVITGLPESQEIDDITAFSELCEYYLPVKPTVTYGGCRRIGKESSDRPRRLLVRLNSEKMATELIRSAPLLRKSDDEYVARKIYINPDLSPSESKLAYEARQRRREWKKQPLVSELTTSATATDITQNYYENHLENDTVEEITTGIDQHTDIALAVVEGSAPNDILTTADVQYPAIEQELGQLGGDVTLPQPAVCQIINNNVTAVSLSDTPPFRGQV